MEKWDPKLLFAEGGSIQKTLKKTYKSPLLLLCYLMQIAEEGSVGIARLPSCLPFLHRRSSLRPSSSTVLAGGSARRRPASFRAHSSADATHQRRRRWKKHHISRDLWPAFFPSGLLPFRRSVAYNRGNIFCVCSCPVNAAAKKLVGGFPISI